MLKLLFGSGLFWAAYGTTVSAPAPPRDDPSAVSVIDLGLPGQTAILGTTPSAQKASLAEVLAGQPGVQLRSAGGLGQWSGAILRGADSSQLAVLVDGVPLPRGAQAAVDLSQLPVDGAERVEIYRGVPPFEIGIDGIGGAINLISRRGTGRPTTWALWGSGSFGLRKLAAGHSGDHGGLHVAATLSYQGATGDFPYLSTAGLLYSNHLVELARRNDGFDQVAAYVRLSGETRRGSYFFGAQGTLKRQGVPGIGQADAQPGQPTLSLGRAVLVGGGQAEFWHGRLQLLADGHALLERSAFTDPAIMPPVSVEQLTQQAGARAVLRLFSTALSDARAQAENVAFSTQPARTLLLMGELRYEHLGSADLCPAPRGDCALALPTESDRLRGLIGVGGELRFFGGGGIADRLLVQPGFHVLLVRSRLQPVAGLKNPGAPVSSDEVFMAPRLAARLHATSWLLLRLSGGRFVRLPTFLELFGDRAFYRPNLRLRPESAWLLEVGARALYTRATRHKELRLSFEAHGFARAIEDLIDTMRNGSTLFADNVGKALAAGVELEGRAQLGELLGVQLAYTFLDARNKTLLSGQADNRLPGRPPHSLFLRLELGGRGFRCGYELDYASATFLDPANLQPRPTRALHALRLQSGPHPVAHLTLGVEIRNLADTRALPVRLSLAQTNTERLVPLSDIYDYPLPGRALYATLSGRF